MNDKTKRKMTLTLTSLNDLFILGLAFLESGFWAKTINARYTIGYFFRSYETVSDAAVNRAGGPAFVSFDSAIPQFNITPVLDIVIAFFLGAALFLFMKLVLSLMFEKAGITRLTHEKTAS
jgi:hypothetical protein